MDINRWLQVIGEPYFDAKALEQTPENLRRRREALERFRSFAQKRECASLEHALEYFFRQSLHDDQAVLTIRFWMEDLCDILRWSGEIHTASLARTLAYMCLMADRGAKRKSELRALTVPQPGSVGLLIFEKEIILKEQLAARCLFQCSPVRKLPANAWHIGDQRTEIRDRKIHT
jgi:hypothetical protein